MKYRISAAVAIILIIASCAAQKKLSNIQGESMTAGLSLGKEVSELPEFEVRQLTRDTLKIRDEEGKEVLIMKAIKDESTGEMVASDVLDAAMITARFRNVAERHGKVDLKFQVTVPEAMRDSKWQLRFYPDMFVLGDSIRLEPVVITGEAYRKAQLKGYQQYDRFLSRIVSDSTVFINLHLLEVFLQRNIPEVYAFKSDSTYVSDEMFYSCYGVSQQQAVEHYTNKIAREFNDRRKSRIDKMYKKYVKAPIVTEGIRLDTVMVSDNGDFIYDYVQTINTRPKLRKADIVLSGEIYEQEKVLYEVPASKPLTFYISSISAFADNRERYLTKVIERQAEANTECHIDFDLGKSEVREDLGENGYEMNRIKETLASLVKNDVYDLDSITVTAFASPEGKYETNGKLSKLRSESVTNYFSKFLKGYRDSLIWKEGVSYNLDETYTEKKAKKQEIIFTPHSIPENWDDLYKLVREDTVMTALDKEDFFTVNEIKDPDARELSMKTKAYYPYMKDSLYPRLRTVKFNFFLHRKGMVKDTVHTTVLDSVYMFGVQCLREMRYDEALVYLRQYNDYNTAVAYVGLDRNVSAMQILNKLEKTAEVSYLLAVLYSRDGDSQKAVESYVRACNLNHTYVYRGNLDPEISTLIKLYGLNKEEEDDFAF